MAASRASRRESLWPVPQIVFGIAIRRGSNSVPLTVEQLHRMCQEGGAQYPSV